MFKRKRVKLQTFSGTSTATHESSHSTSASTYTQIRPLSALTPVSFLSRKKLIETRLSLSHLIARQPWGYQTCRWMSSRITDKFHTIKCVWPQHKSTWRSIKFDAWQMQTVLKLCSWSTARWQICMNPIFSVFSHVGLLNATGISMFRGCCCHRSWKSLV